MLIISLEWAENFESACIKDETNRQHPQVFFFIDNMQMLAILLAVTIIAAEVGQSFIFIYLRGGYSEFWIFYNSQVCTLLLVCYNLKSLKFSGHFVDYFVRYPDIKQTKKYKSKRVSCELDFLRFG